MGSRVQKIAFLIFALMFVAIMAILNTSILTLGTSANGQLTTTVSSDDSALSIYDNNSVYGSSVINCAKDPTSVGDTILNVFVFTNSSAGDKQYKDGSVYANPASTADEFINRTAKFDSYLCYNNNGVCTGVCFIQQGRSGVTTSSVSALDSDTTVVSGLA